MYYLVPSQNISGFDVVVSKTNIRFLIPTVGKYLLYLLDTQYIILSVQKLLYVVEGII